MLGSFRANSAPIVSLLTIALAGMKPLDQSGKGSQINNSIVGGRMKIMTTATKNTIIRMLGNVHCGQSDWQAIEFVFSKMSQAKKDLLKPRQVKALEKFIAKEHQRNYFEYRQIMGGNF